MRVGTHLFLLLFSSSFALKLIYTAWNPSLRRPENFFSAKYQVRVSI